ncbi:PAS domain-containing protein, partial [Providencia stuartii]|uniref:PAS domain-containing protein n=2 Tax=Pseudomonadota TaxID=1224 RepID=UPI0013D40972
VLAGVSAGVVGLDSNGRISAANRQAAALLGLDGPVYGLSLAEAAPEFVAVAARAAETGVDAEEEVDLVRDREMRRLRVRASGHS